MIADVLGEEMNSVTHLGRVEVWYTTAALKQTTITVKYTVFVTSGSKGRVSTLCGLPCVKIIKNNLPRFQLMTEDPILNLYLCICV